MLGYRFTWSQSQPFIIRYSDIFARFSKAPISAIAAPAVSLTASSTRVSPIQNRGAQPSEFYHGTSLDAALKIQDQGFRVELSGKNDGMKLGQGVYCSTNLEKALTYAKISAKKDR